MLAELKAFRQQATAIMQEPLDERPKLPSRCRPVRPPERPQPVKHTSAAAPALAAAPAAPLSTTMAVAADGRCARITAAQATAKSTAGGTGAS